MSLRVYSRFNGILFDIFNVYKQPLWIPKVYVGIFMAYWGYIMVDCDAWIVLRYFTGLCNILNGFL